MQKMKLNYNYLVQQVTVCTMSQTLKKSGETVLKVDKNRIASMFTSNSLSVHRQSCVLSLFCEGLSLSRMPL